MRRCKQRLYGKTAQVVEPLLDTTAEGGCPHIAQIQLALAPVQNTIPLRFLRKDLHCNDAKDQTKP